MGFHTCNLEGVLHRHLVHGNVFVSVQDTAGPRAGAAAAGTQECWGGPCGGADQCKLQPWSHQGCAGGTTM